MLSKYINLKKKKKVNSTFLFHYTPQPHPHQTYLEDQPRILGRGQGNKGIWMEPCRELNVTGDVQACDHNHAAGDGVTRFSGYRVSCFSMHLVFGKSLETPVLENYHDPTISLTSHLVVPHPQLRLLF